MEALSGNALDYVKAFGAGLAVSFSPCVYPVMPITASILGSLNTQGSKWRGFLISLVYVLGLAITYCLLAMGAALTGKIFGQYQNNPVIYIVVANVLIVFALAMFDVIPMPMLGFNFQQRIKITNLGAVLLMGMAAGLVVGPCTAPILGSLLLYVASKQNVFYGASLLFVFSYGVGASLILIGTFSNLVANLPRSGRWLIWIKRIAGAVLLIIAQQLLLKAGGLML